MTFAAPFFVEAEIVEAVTCGIGVGVPEVLLPLDEVDGIPNWPVVDTKVTSVPSAAMWFFASRTTAPIKITSPQLTVLEDALSFIDPGMLVSGEQTCWTVTSPATSPWVVPTVTWTV